MRGPYPDRIIPDEIVGQDRLPIELPEVHVREDLRMTLRYNPGGKLDFSRMVYEPMAVSYRRIVTVKTDLV